MEIERYFSVSGDQIVFTRQQSSEFAKLIAGDFNPLHDVDAKRFCVPGDLLFAVHLSRHGVFEGMTFDFLAMVDASAPLREIEKDNQILLTDDRQREFLAVRSDGAHSQSRTLINSLTLAYVRFSGQTFPYLLVDLMRNNDVMINPDRPLVIYRSMEITLFGFDDNDITLQFTGATLHPEGKKAGVELNFDIHAGSGIVGKGQKKMMLGGLRTFDESEMTALVDKYLQIKEHYKPDKASITRF